MEAEEIEEDKFPLVHIFYEREKQKENGYNLTQCLTIFGCRVHVGQPCGKASWESLVGKTRGKTADPLIHATDWVKLLLPLWRIAQVHARIRAED